MFDWAWLSASPTHLVMIVLSSFGIYVALIIYTRLLGLRSFSKLSSFDFAITVAIGSVIASTILAETPALIEGVVGLAALYFIQYVVSNVRRKYETVEHVVDNEPLLIMAGDRVLSDHLDKAAMTEDDLRSKLRMAGISHPNQVLAVVLETTGDVAVLKSDDETTPWIFEGVRGADQLSFMDDDAGLR